MHRLILTVFIILAAATSAYGAIKEEAVEYQAGNTKLKGYLVYNDSIADKRPGVIVVHEWWGLNDYARKRAHKVAELGYIALAIDMYGDGRQASHPDEAGKFADEVSKNIELSKARFMAAYDLLKKQPFTDPKRIAAIGYCFGGGVVLQMAREGIDLAGVVSFHGNLATSRPAKPGMFKAQVLVLHGADDRFVTQEQIEQFKEEMKNAKTKGRLIVYPNAMHGFTNPDADGLGEKFNMPLKYNRKVDQQSWDEMVVFLRSLFNQ